MMMLLTEQVNNDEFDLILVVFGNFRICLFTHRIVRLKKLIFVTPRECDNPNVFLMNFNSEIRTRDQKF